MRKRLIFFAIINVLLFTLPNAKATTITADDGWHVFGFPGVLNPVAPDDYSWFDSFDFSLTQPALLTVQDLGDSTDQFRVSDNGAVIFTTSSPSGGGVGDIFDPDIAAGIPELSHGSFLLGPGAHLITGVNIRFLSTDVGGSAALRLDTVTISEPDIIPLMALCLLTWVTLRTCMKKHYCPVN